MFKLAKNSVPSFLAISRKVDMPQNQDIWVCNCKVCHTDVPHQLLSFIKGQEFWVPLEQSIVFLHPLLYVCCRGNGNGLHRLLALWQSAEMQGMRSLLLECKL